MFSTGIVKRVIRSRWSDPLSSPLGTRLSLGSGKWTCEKVCMPCIAFAAIEVSAPRGQLSAQYVV